MILISAAISPVRMLLVLISKNLRFCESKIGHKRKKIGEEKKKKLEIVRRMTKNCFGEEEYSGLHFPFDK